MKSEVETGYGYKKNILQEYNYDDFLRYLEDPIRNEKLLRTMFNSIYDKSTHLKRLINYFCNMLLFYYELKPSNIDYDKLDSEEMEKIKKQYLKISKELDLMNFKHEIRKALKIALKQDVFYGYEVSNENSYSIMHLPPDYCKITGIEDGCYTFAFDFSYFNIKKNKERLKEFPEEFKEKYAEYERRNKRKEARWIELDPKKSICLKINEEISYPLPPFIGVIDGIFEIEDYKRMRKAKTIIDNYKLIVQKIPIRTDSENNNDFIVDPDFVRYFHNEVVKNLPAQVGLATVPFEVSEVEFESEKTDRDSVNRATRDFWNSAGILHHIFGAEQPNASTVKRAVETDEQFMFGVLRQIERWVNRKLKYTWTAYKFQIEFLNITHFNKDEYIDRIKNMAEKGLAVKSKLYAAMGYSPVDIINMDLLENKILNISSSLIPLPSSHTQPSNNEGGRDKKDDVDLSDEGTKTRDEDGNETRE